MIMVTLALLKTKCFELYKLIEWMNGRSRFRVFVWLQTNASLARTVSYKYTSLHFYNGKWIMIYLQSLSTWSMRRILRLFWSNSKHLKCRIIGHKVAAAISKRQKCMIEQIWLFRRQYKYLFVQYANEK